MTGRIETLERWRLDWACTRCHKHGTVPVEMGGPVDPGTGKRMPRTDDATMFRNLELAHREATAPIICLNKPKRLKLGRIWRREQISPGRNRMIVMAHEGYEPAAYVWPPWNK